MKMFTGPMISAALMCFAAANGWAEVGNRAKMEGVVRTDFIGGIPTEFSINGAPMPAAVPVSLGGWQLGKLSYSTGAKDIFGEEKTATIREGYFLEAPGVPFRGNVLYLEGLSDSMLNHDPLFSKLSNAGYRVISFDYMGQGGSTGEMNWTRLRDDEHPGLEIASIAEIVWSELRRKDPNVKDKKIVMGWSTGGLAAYQMAYRKQADAVILIAPAIHDKVGTIKVTLKALTHADYRYESNPHKDPISPQFPISVPSFVFNLLGTTGESQSWGIPTDVQGLALLSGESDPLVDGKETLKTLSQYAPHFRAVRYEKSAHEIDNEVKDIRDAAAREILDFLRGLQ